ncbi:hypothetical protein C8D87_11171 [Lentzea atacamensis]|uniref:Uncharacterized protein n=1 Tax=Lentzea atacamensis TaxID=531938 RepID=A0ABX9DY83_9PSEU|nr:hypothetical protein [Lentzea atacamensis]RAS60653.1 hypothetical protein C8D87_11171 [Lentzea atacamensis]
MAERLIDRLLIINERHLKSVLNRQVSHYNTVDHTESGTTLHRDRVARSQNPAVATYVVGERSAA